MLKLCRFAFRCLGQHFTGALPLLLSSCCCGKCNRGASPVSCHMLKWCTKSHHSLVTVGEESRNAPLQKKRPGMGGKDAERHSRNGSANAGQRSNAGSSCRECWERGSPKSRCQTAFEATGLDNLHRTSKCQQARNARIILHAVCEWDLGLATVTGCAATPRLKWPRPSRWCPNTTRRPQRRPRSPRAATISGGPFGLWAWLHRPDVKG